MRPGAELSKRAGFVILLGLVGAFHVATLRSGHGWGDDFAMYIHHAKNLAEGLPYASTGYIYNPHNPAIGPSVYPPGFPLLLAPVYKVFGLDLEAMRVELVALLLASLALAAALFWRELPPFAVAVVIGAIGFNPALWSLFEQVLSDIPFLLFCLAAIVLLRHLEQHSIVGRPGSMTSAAKTANTVLLGLACYLAFATRTVGAILVVCVLLSDLHAHRRLTRLTTLSIPVVVVLAGAQRVIFGSTESYLDQLVLDPPELWAVIVLNLKSSFLTLVELWGTDAKDPLGTLLTAAIVAWACLGFVLHGRRDRGVLVTFPVLYSLVVVAWPNFQGFRFLLPLLPFYVFFAVRGIENLTQSARNVRPYAAVCALLVVGVFYMRFYLHASYGPIQGGVFAASSTQLFDFITTHTNTDDVFVFFKPRALALFTGRQASAYHSPEDQAALLEYFRSIGTKFVIVGSPDIAWSNRFIASDPTHFVSIYSNDEFRVYQAIDN